MEVTLCVALELRKRRRGEPRESSGTMTRSQTVLTQAPCLLAKSRCMHTRNSRQLYPLVFKVLRQTKCDLEHCCLRFSQFIKGRFPCGHFDDGAAQRPNVGCFPIAPGSFVYYFWCHVLKGTWEEFKHSPTSERTYNDSFNSST